LQTNNLRILKKKQKEKGYIMKLKEILNLKNLLIFNKGIVSQKKNNLVLQQKQQNKKLKLVNYNNPDFK
jgi:hypothetical protein